MRSLLCLSGLLCAVLSVARADDDPFRVLDGTAPRDARLGKPKDYNGYFPWTPPTHREVWEVRRQEVREQILVANGLWPMPERAPLRPVMHGKIERDGYTIEKVYFATYPGHYVSGNLYRPTGKTGKLPGVLAPHGHSTNGRFTEGGLATAEADVKKGADKTIEAARYYIQARCAQLARMGCVVFNYDMVGYADSQMIRHRTGFMDADAELRLQSLMGLQTFNSIRSLDFLLGLPDVDPNRIGVTGESGGGTQTMLLCAIDDRPTVAFPAVMVSTAMQGGCQCENCSYLRVNTGNIEFAGLFAPKPMGMSAANDWTVDIETRGLPELKALYKLYGAEDRVMAKGLPQFGHNYNQVSRELMYNWFNQHLHLGLAEPVEEKPFTPVSPAELSVFDAEHPVPRDAAGAERLRQSWTALNEKQLAALKPATADGFRAYRRVIGAALRVMINDRLPASAEVEAEKVGDKIERDGLTWRRFLLSRQGAGEKIPAVGLRGAEFDGTVVVWVHPEGKKSLWKDGKLTPAARQILDRKAAILAPDVFLTGEYGDTAAPAVDKAFAGYTFGYNRTLLANRVRDILTTVAYARGDKHCQAVYLVGWDKAGPWVVLARGLCGDAVLRTAADLDEFRFDAVKTTDDPMMLPGGVKYGGLGALAGVSAPAELFAYRAEQGAAGWLRAAYASAGAASRLQVTGAAAPPEKVVDWLLR
jgi:dienelactone hydrolase